MTEYDYIKQHRVPPPYVANAIMTNAINDCIKILADAQRRCEILKEMEKNDR